MSLKILVPEMVSSTGGSHGTASSQRGAIQLPLSVLVVLSRQRRTGRVGCRGVRR